MTSAALECNLNYSDPKALREWLSGDWALVFSHPADFAPQDFEGDRWLAVAANALANSRIRLLGLVRGAHEGQWLAELDGRGGALRLAPAARRPPVISLLQHVIASALASTSGRCVLVLDGELRVRRTYVYGGAAACRSLFDLIAIASDARSADRCRRADAGSSAGATARRELASLVVSRKYG